MTIIWNANSVRIKLRFTVKTAKFTSARLVMIWSMEEMKLRPMMRKEEFWISWEINIIEFNCLMQSLKGLASAGYIKIEIMNTMTKWEIRPIALFVPLKLLKEIKKENPVWFLSIAHMTLQRKRQKQTTLI